MLCYHDRYVVYVFDTLVFAEVQLINNLLVNRYHIQIGRSSEIN